MKRKDKKKFILYLVTLMIGAFFYSCSKMEDLHEKYLKGGEIIYPGKVDSIEILGGENRVKVIGIKPTDPKVTRGKIYWNNRKDSVDFDVSNDSEPYIEVLIDNLTEGAYTFEVITFNQSGNISVINEARGNSYGEEFESTIINRQIKEYGYASGKVTIEWYPAEETDKEVIVSYKNNLGNMVEVAASNEEETTVLENYKNGNPFTYYTIHLPESDALDSFNSKSTTVEVIPVEVQLDSDLFEVYSLPGDAAPQNASHSLSRLWNGNILDDYRTKNGSPMPHHYNWYLGVTATLTKIVLFQRGANSDPTTTEGKLTYANANFETFEIWGSNNPNPDGSFDGWTLLGSFESHKPSGLPVGQNTPEDYDFAKVGEVFEFPNDIESVKYIRLKVTKTWGGTTHSFANQVYLMGIIE